MLCNTEIRFWQRFADDFTLCSPHGTVEYVQHAEHQPGKYEVTLVGCQPRVVDGSYPVVAIPN